jgi:DNA-binding NtrC family response regulator
MVDDDHEIKDFILIADDDISYAEAFGKMLELRGYKTIITDSAENITKLIDQNDFDLVTLDLDWGDEGVSGIGI